MEGFWIDSLGISVKSALRNLKFAILLGAMLFALCNSASAQQPTKVARIGFLIAASRSAIPAIVTTGSSVTRAAKEATVTIPIVMAQDNVLLATGSLPASRALAETSLDCQLFARR
jgi:hypothetical protein